MNIKWAPPILFKCYGYSYWKYGLETWQVFTSLKKKPKSLLALSLTGQKEQVIRSINIEDKVEKMGLHLLTQN